MLVAAGLFAFLGIRPYQPWILWLTAALAGLAVDGIVRASPRWPGHGVFGSVVYVVLPALAVLGAGFFIDHAIDGYARMGAALVPAVAAGFIAWAEYQTVDLESRRYGTMRLALAVATYLAAFALYTVIFTNHLGLLVGTVCTGLVSMALALELLRETRPLGPSALLVSLAIGVSLAELRLALYFFPLDGLLAGALLIIGFYLATGIIHHLLDHDLEWATTAEYLLVALVGTAAVVITRVTV
ncbi:MAG: hypothetical protein ACKVT1_07040 [Dehalococcoidia bacterium]